MEKSKYTFKLEENDGSITTLEFREDTLGKIVDHFRNFLIGCTFDVSQIENAFYDLINEGL